MEYKEVSDAFATAHGVLDWLESKVNRGFVSRFYTTKYGVKWYTPPVLVCKTYEIDEPFRQSWTFFLRTGFKTIRGYGIWSKHGLPEHEALLKAVRAGQVDEDYMEHFDVDAIQGEFEVVDGVGGFKPRGLRSGATGDAGVE